MDPNANLQELLRLSAQVDECLDRCGDEPHAPCRGCSQRAMRMAELIGAMHGWITNGGFLPKMWQSGR